MICKNCENSLQTDYSFCPDCGAKVIRNRLTIKNLLSDFIERYFNVVIYTHKYLKEIR